MSRRVLLIAVAIAVVGGVAPSALAAQERTGDEFFLLNACLDGNQAIMVVDTPKAGEPFHIAHGWSNRPSDVDDLGQYDFELWVDGQSQKGKLDVTTSRDEDGTQIARTFVHNYPDGLAAGPHTIRAVWSDPTGVVLDCKWDVYFLDPNVDVVEVTVSEECLGAEPDSLTRVTVENAGTVPFFVELGIHNDDPSVGAGLAPGQSLFVDFEADNEYEWQVEYPPGYIFDRGVATIQSCAW